MKAILKSITYVSFVLSILLIHSTSFAQGNLTGTFPVTINPLNPPNCPQGNVTIDEIEFRGSDGNVLNPNTEFEIGELVEGQIWFDFGGSSSNAYNLYIQYDIFINDVKFGPTITLCRFGGQNIPNGLNDGFQFIDDFSWSFGDKLEIKNIYMTWRTGSADNGNCVAEFKNAQCYWSEPGLVVRTPLVANFDFEDRCEDLQIRFFDNSTGGDPTAYTWKWSVDLNGDGNFTQFSTVQNPTYLFPNAGTYNVKLETTSEGTITSERIEEVTVFGPLSVGATRIDDDCAVEGAGSITLNVSGGDANYTFAWTASNGGVIEPGNENIQSQTNLGPGSYTVITTDGRGCVNTTTFNITRPNTAPAPSVFSNENYCVGSGVQGYNITADAGYSLLYYDSQTSDLPFEAVPTVDTDNVAAGTYSVWVAQVKEDQCESTRVEVSITVNPLPVLSITNPTSVCEPGTVDLTNSAITAGSSAGLTFTYFSDAAGTEALENPAAIIIPGTYYIKATNANGCSVIEPVVVVINDAPVAPVSTGNIVECADATIQTLDANDAIETVSGITYRWYATATGGSEVTPTLSSIGSATYYAEAVSEEGCASLERTPVTLTINDCRVAITKEVDFDVIDAPTTLNYTIRVTNPGNTPLTGVVVTDPLTNDATPLVLASGDTNGDGNLDTDETWVYNASYAVDQDMIDAGIAIVNTAFVNTDFTGEEEASVTTTITQAPAVSIEKVVDLGSISAPQT
ncbi:hypothetical protein, partial [Belliella pelovolcani]|uniref:Ig-like domain-containing protein n=1 Tax=Belliella pelovolcani TaxID=529505 RepID=UPI00391C6EB8